MISDVSYNRTRLTVSSLLDVPYKTSEAEMIQAEEC